jgi:hypothetical protein
MRRSTAGCTGPGVLSRVLRIGGRDHFRIAWTAAWVQQRLSR